jgi:hypothetical protein
MRTALLLSVLLFSTSCLGLDKAATEAGKQAKAQATAVADTAGGKKPAPAVEEVTSPVHVGLPRWAGGKGMLYVKAAGLNAQLNSSPFEYWAAKITILAVWLTVISLIGLIAAGILCYLRFPLWKEAAIISGGVCGFSLAIVLLVDMLVTIWPWLLGAAIVGVIGFIAYLLLVKTKLLKTCKELYQTGAKMKHFTKWEEPEKLEVLKLQSDPTIELVNQFEQEDEAAKKKLERKAGQPVTA